MMKGSRRELSEEWRHHSFPDDRAMEDRPHGKCIIWHENGKKKMEKYYKNGIKHGKFKCWDENGVRLGEGDVVNGLPHGISITYDSNGLKIIEYFLL